MRTFVALLLAVAETTSATELRYPPTDIECALWLNYLGDQSTNEALVPFVPIFAKDRRYVGRPLEQVDADMLRSVLADDVEELVLDGLAHGKPARFFLAIEALGMLHDLAGWTPMLWAAATARGQLLTENGVTDDWLARQRLTSLKILAGVGIAGVATVTSVFASLFVPGLHEAAPNFAHYATFGFLGTLPLGALLWQWSRWQARKREARTLKSAQQRAEALRARGARHSAALDILEMVDGQVPFSTSFHFGETKTPNVVAGNVFNPATGYIEPFVLILSDPGQ